MPEFYIKIARKFFSRILGGGARAAPASPSPTPMVHPKIQKGALSASNGVKCLPVLIPVLVLPPKTISVLIV